VKAYVIEMRGHAYSEAVADRCVRSAWHVGKLAVERFPAVREDTADAVMKARGLEWTWTTSGIRWCKATGLRMHPYPGRLAPRIACAMSHRLLWERCRDAGEPVLILEHDAVFERAFETFEFETACQINDPRGATRRGDWWSEAMRRRKPGVYPKTWVTDPRDQIPDGLAGNSAYLLQPGTADRLCHLQETFGVWPNDATLCEQLVPGLQERYPFVTRVEQMLSTTSE
jgi:GR25 family glycosyltransferase involved in LPS biosynthesis